MQLEHRAVAELRTEGQRLVGLVVPFDTPAQIGRTTEVVKRGAFAASLGNGSDVRAFVDHDQTRLLGRTRTGSLRLAEAARGLAFEIDVPDTGTGRDVLTLAARGDLSGMSFGFNAVNEKWSGRRRELRAVDLVEISVITGGQPAYPDTTVAVRHRADAVRQLTEAISLAAASLRPRRDGVGLPTDGPSHVERRYP